MCTCIKLYLTKFSKIKKINIKICCINIDLAINPLHSNKFCIRLFIVYMILYTVKIKRTAECFLQQILQICRCCHALINRTHPQFNNEIMLFCKLQYNSLFCDFQTIKYSFIHFKFYHLFTKNPSFNPYKQLKFLNPKFL